MVDEPTHHSPDEYWRGSGDGQVNAHGEGQRRDAAEFENDGDENAQQNQAPWQVTAQDPFDDVGNERGLRGGELLDVRPVRPLVVDAVNARVREINRNAFAVHQI